MTLPKIPTPPPVPPRPQPSVPVDFFRRAPGGGTAYVKPAGVLPDPNGCAACGEGKDTHLQRWAPDVRWHTWIAPDDAIRLARMKTACAAHRAARLTDTPEDPR